MIPPDYIYIATGNAHKVQEISDILGGAIRCISMKSLDRFPELVEDGDTFEDNALAKAAQLAAWLHAQNIPSGEWMTLADDSGLEVDALNGQPGVYSARFAADETGASGNADDAANNAKLLRLLKDTPDEQRTGRFRCVLALVQSPSPSESSQHWTFDGACEGIIRRQLSGEKGFGYDPLFQPEGHEHTFAELGPEVKNTISHRSRALAKLKAFLSQ